MKPDSLDLRVKMLRAEAEHAWERKCKHEAKHGCGDWQFRRDENGRLRLDLSRACVVRGALQSAWIGLLEVSELPSPDPRMYRDADPEWTAPLQTEGEAHA